MFWAFFVCAYNVLLRDAALEDEEIDIKYAYQDMWDFLQLRLLPMEFY